MSMQVGISTGYFYEKDLIQSLPLIRGAGFRVVELWAGTREWGEYAHYDWHSKTYTSRLKRRLKELGVAVSSLHAPYALGVDLSDLDDFQRGFAVRETQRAAQALADCGGRFLVVHPAVAQFDLKNIALKERRVAQSKKSLSEIVPHTRKLGLTLAVENLLPHILGGEADILLELVGDYSPKEVGVCFDTGHAHLWKTPPLTEIIRSLGERIVCLHVHDNYGKNDDHFSVGDGNIEWQEALASIRESAFDGVFMLEVMGESRYKEPRRVLSRAFKNTAALLFRG